MEFRLIGEAVLLGLSLCADCFAVSLCSAFAMEPEAIRRRVGKVAAVFAVVQTGLFLCGWLLGAFASDLLEKLPWFHRAARITGFLLLLYVGGDMFVEGVRGRNEHLNLKGFRSILLGGIATSIDALAVGLSMALAATPWAAMVLPSVSIFIFTVLSVVVGMLWGGRLGRKLGQSARIIGGLVLMALGVKMLF